MTGEKKPFRVLSLDGSGSSPARGVVSGKFRERDWRPTENCLHVGRNRRAELLPDEPVESNQPFGSFRRKTGAFNGFSRGLFTDRDVLNRSARRARNSSSDLVVVESLPTCERVSLACMTLISQRCGGYGRDVPHVDVRELRVGGRNVDRAS